MIIIWISDKDDRTEYIIDVAIIFLAYLLDLGKEKVYGARL
jgi:hypothetical protein